MNEMKWIKQIIGKEAEKAGFTDGGSCRDGYVRGYVFYCTYEEERYEDIIDFTIIFNRNYIVFLLTFQSLCC